jgi:hypothetical protein
MTRNYRVNGLFSQTNGTFVSHTGRIRL